MVVNMRTMQSNAMLGLLSLRVDEFQSSAEIDCPRQVGAMSFRMSCMLAPRK